MGLVIPTWLFERQQASSEETTNMNETNQTEFIVNVIPPWRDGRPPPVPVTLSESPIIKYTYHTSTSPSTSVLPPISPLGTAVQAAPLQSYVRPLETQRCRNHLA